MNQALAQNPMRKIRIEKITLNIGAGEPGPQLEKSKKVLETLTHKTVIFTKTHKRSTFGGGKGRDIGVKVTVRGDEAKELLKKLLQAIENRIKPNQFDSTGNFSFGIEEYIRVPGTRYDPDIGILGLDVAVTLSRPGYRVKQRRTRPAKVGKTHTITKEEAIEFATNVLGINVTEEED